MRRAESILTYESSDDSGTGDRLPEASSSGRPRKADLSSVWVVIPAFNETDVVRRVVEAVLAQGCRVIVVDDGSAIPVERVLAGTGANVLRHPVNLGQGAALRSGISYALEQGARYLVTFDADGQHRSEDIVPIVAPLLKGECQVTLGSRFLPAGKAVNIPWTRRKLLRVATLYTRFVTGMALTDTHNGIRGLTAAAASAIPITRPRLAHASALLRDIQRHQLSYQEVPVVISYTDYSLSKSKRAGDLLALFWHAAKELVRF